MKMNKTVAAIFYLTLFLAASLPVSPVVAADLTQKEMTVVSTSQRTNDYQVIKVINPIAPSPESKQNDLKRFLKNSFRITAGLNLRHADNGFSFFTHYIFQCNFFSLTALREHLVFSILLI